MKDHSLLYIALMVLALAADIKLVHKFRTHLWSYFLGFAIYGAAMVGLAIELRMDGFNVLKLLCYSVFAGGFILCCALAWLARPKFKVISIFFAFLAFLLIPIAIDAFLIEPHHLDRRDVYLSSSKIKTPITIAVVSDLQTDRVGSFERKCLEYVMKQSPDLILLPGDYIQIDDWSSRQTQIDKLQNILNDIQFSAPLGTYAVRGNVEFDDWTNTFSRVPIATFPTSNHVSMDGITISGLSFDDSFNYNLKVASQPGFHIVFGHGPDFALGSIDADLLVAGHTHGGQVALPFLGPVITLSHVPRRWVTDGTEQLDPDTVLVLSRGIGMERRYAPRLRFGCKPELVFVHLEAGQKGTHFDKQIVQGVF